MAESENTASAPFQEGAGQNSSILARVDARVKIVCAVLWSLMVSWLHGTGGAWVALAAAVALIALARWPRRNLINRLLTVNIFFMFMWLMLPFSFSSPGHVVATIGPLKVTREGLDLATLLTLKGNAIVLAVLAILGTSPLYVLAAAGRRLRFPEKLVGLFLLTVRYYQVIFKEYQRLRKAMRARGFKLGLSRNSLRGVSNLVGSLLVRSFDRAERVHRAMVSRGYMGIIWVRAEFRLKGIDLAFTLVMLALFVLVGGGEWKR
ncbi:MAG: cobalt ECF transporter T component CbiQ [Deltaproteobacteria bacterium]|jgi:cobalt/nickel transport system permease protein|nr:cobalt ECF transporter T component CbiQ [Deltaproteobacteria bacterium]